MVWSDNIPWNYLPEWLWISTPLVVILGLVLSPLVLWRKYDTAAARRVPLLFGLLIFAGVFPVVYAIYKKSNLYDGMRHFLFIYPVFPVLAAWGWGSLAERLPAAFGRLGVGLVVMGLLAMPLHWLWRSHPYQYVYFNELSGGLKAAYSEYETDYWMTAMRRCSKWLVENEPKIKKGDTLYVSTNCFHPVKHYFSKYPNVIVRYTNYHDREKNAWDYGLFYPRFLDPKFLASEIWPSKYSVYAEEVDGVKLGAVLKNPYPKHGAEALRLSTTTPEQSVALLEELVKNDPKNESAWMILAQIRLQMNNTAGAKSALDTLIALSDQYVNSMSILGMYYFQVNQIDSAKAVFERGTQVNYKYPYGYYQLARIAFSKNEFPKAMEYIDLFDKHGGKPDDGYNIGIQLAEKLNDNARLYYFQAKVLFAQNKVSEGYNMLQQAVLANKNYEPAAKLKRDYDQLIEEQRKEQVQQRRKK
jgi:tetratricopeptide (TPR) repeat protein